MRLRRPSILPRVVLAAALMVAAACGDPAAPPDPNDPDALLTDAQLAIAPDPAEAPVDPAWDQWVRANHHTLRSLTSTRFDDLQFLRNAIGSRRVVQLGESGHGVREFNLAKVRLIRFLHEEMGFDVLAFESGLFECWNADRMADTADAGITMGRCPFGVWHTEEVLELFEYVKATHATSRPLVVAGFDVQMSGGTARRYAPGFLAEVVGRVDPAYAAEVRAMDETFHAEYSFASGTSVVEPSRRLEVFGAMEAEHRFVDRYRALAAFIDANAARLAAAYPSVPTTPLAARQLAWSRAQLMTGATLARHIDALRARDRDMADNVDFLLDRMYPGKKVVVWAHNAHVMHDRASMRMADGGFAVYPQSMGAFIAQRRRAELYTIGLFMYRGRAADNGRTVYDVAPPLPNSLEATLHRARRQWVFVDLLGQQRSAGTSWMFDRIPIKEWGKNDYSVVPRAQFDGILFLDTVSPPRYHVFPPHTQF